MSERRVRLRLAGESDERAVPIREGAARALLPAPSIAVVAAIKPGDAEAFAASLVAGARGAGVEARVLRAAIRERPGSEDGEDVVRASSDAIAEALDALVARAAREGELVIGVGLPFVALRRAGLSVLVTSGAPAVHWDPSLRALRDRFELALSEPRPALARELVARLSSAGRE